MPEEKRKPRTSSAVKRKYNQKTYKRITVDLRFADYDEFEELRGEMSRAEFVRQLMAFWKENH